MLSAAGPGTAQHAQHGGCTVSGEKKEVRRLGVANGETWPRPSPQVKTNNMFSSWLQFLKASSSVLAWAAGAYAHFWLLERLLLVELL